MHVYSLYNQLGQWRTANGGSGYVAPTAVAPSPPPPSPIVSAPVASTGYTYQPPGYAADAGGGSILPYIEQRYTQEQLIKMIREGELTDRQTRPGGDGPDYELEQQANDANATEKAVNDAKAGIGVPKPLPKTGMDLAPLALLAAAAYFLL